MRQSDHGIAACSLAVGPAGWAWRHFIFPSSGRDSRVTWIVTWRFQVLREAERGRSGRRGGWRAAREHLRPAFTTTGRDSLSIRSIQCQFQGLGPAFSAPMTIVLALSIDFLRSCVAWIIIALTKLSCQTFKLDAQGTSHHTHPHPGPKRCDI